jgi:hypothetical protein
MDGFERYREDNNNRGSILCGDDEEQHSVWRFTVQPGSWVTMPIQRELFNKVIKCKFRTISFSGNLTWCSKDQTHTYNEYCSFSKSFLVESMDIVTTSTISSSVWIVIIVCTLAIIFGILIMLM